jgi:superfamily I DNA/RNA helicase
MYSALVALSIVTTGCSGHYLLVDEFQDANVAQIELIELLGRAPDRPDNVMVVGDDDQSIYRFRGASFAAFAEFDTRFARPPAHDPTATPPGPPPRLRLEQNFRSVGHVLTGANRLIELERETARFAAPMAPRLLKEVHFASANVARSRDLLGRVCRSR